MRALLEEGVALFRTLGDDWGLAVALCSLGMATAELGDPAAPALFGESLVHARATGDAWATARVVNCLGEIARADGDDDRAAVLYAESLALFRTLEQRRRTALILHNLGRVLAHRGDLRRAAASFAEGLAQQEEHGDCRAMSYCLMGLAGMIGRLGQPHQAARLFGVAQLLAEDRDVVFETIDRLDHERDIAAVRAVLGRAAFAAAWTAGYRLPLDQAIAAALAAAETVRATPATVSPAPGPPTDADGLTGREREVLRLLVEGATNPEIAAALFISGKTASKHVTSILAKLGTLTRTAAATYAVRHGLV
jgi:DNA-binding CsgD family transcriptional regulator